MKKVVLFFILVFSSIIYASEVGRFQIISTSNSLNILLDTVTGKTWTKGCAAYESKANPDSKCAIAAWMPHDITGINPNDDKKFWKSVADWESTHP